MNEVGQSNEEATEVVSRLPASLSAVFDDSSDEGDHYLSGTAEMISAATDQVQDNTNNLLSAELFRLTAEYKEAGNNPAAIIF